MTMTQKIVAEWWMSQKAKSVNLIGSSLHRFSGFDLCFPPGVEMVELRDPVTLTTRIAVLFKGKCLAEEIISDYALITSSPDCLRDRMRQLLDRALYGDGIQVKSRIVKVPEYKISEASPETQKIRTRAGQIEV